MVLSAVRINPVKQPVKYAVIFLHGLGDSGAGWTFLSDQAQSFNKDSSSKFYGKFDHVKFIFPNAPSIPVTCNNGHRMPAWFDIFSLGGTAGAEDTKGFLKSVETIKQYIDEVVNETGISEDKIILGGFSQGAALSLASTVYLDKKLAGFVSMSGFLRTKDELIDTIKNKYGDDPKKLVNYDTPILHCHGDSDPVIPYEFGLLTKDFYKKELGFPKYKFLKFTGLQHSASPIEIENVLEFIQQVTVEKE